MTFPSHPVPDVKEVEDSGGTSSSIKDGCCSWSHLALVLDLPWIVLNLVLTGGITGVITGEDHKWDHRQDGNGIPPLVPSRRLASEVDRPLGGR